MVGGVRVGLRPARTPPTIADGGPVGQSPYLFSYSYGP